MEGGRDEPPNYPESTEIKKLKESKRGDLLPTMKAIEAAKKRNEGEKERFRRVYPEVLKEEFEIVFVYDRQEYPEFPANERDVKRVFGIKD